MASVADRNVSPKNANMGLNVCLNTCGAKSPFLKQTLANWALRTLRDMNRTFSLAHLTALALKPAELIHTATKLGFAGCGLRLLPAATEGLAYNLMADNALRAETLAALRDSPIKVLDLEIIRIGERFDATQFRAFFEVGAALGAKHILVAGDDAEEPRLTENFGKLCEAAQAFNLSCDLEFMPFTAVKDAATAARIMRAVEQPNAAILVDAIHFFRSRSMLSDVSDLPRSALNYVQISDGKVPGPVTNAGLIHDARCERLLPGEGGFALAAMLGALPNDLPISVEIPNDARAPKMGYEAWAAAALEATKKMLAAPKSTEFEDIKI
jgi:sugar phosphate isomerase/epimerase